MAKCSRCGADTELFDRGVPICPSCDAKPQSKRQHIASLLRIRLEAARIRRFVAEKTLADIAREVPGTLPAPDGLFRIQKAGCEHLEALKAVNLATRNLNNFLLNGRVPLDLDLREESATEQTKPSSEKA
jgi:hypothetical protein